MKRASIVSIVIVATSGTAAAEPTASVTWSPVHLVLPVVEVEGEYNVAPHMGVGVIGGAGRVSNEDESITATAYEIGGQYNYYFMRPFSGLHAGAELLYLHVGDVAQDMTLTGAGLSAGPYAGYKLQTDIGFAFVAQLGVGFMLITAENASAMTSDRKVYPLVNLNVGWSF
jgi:hypothetical protein